MAESFSDMFIGIQLISVKQFDGSHIMLLLTMVCFVLFSMMCHFMLSFHVVHFFYLVPSDP